VRHGPGAVSDGAAFTAVLALHTSCAQKVSPSPGLIAAATAPERTFAGAHATLPAATNPANAAAANTRPAAAPLAWLSNAQKQQTAGAKSLPSITRTPAPPGPPQDTIPASHPLAAGGQAVPTIAEVQPTGLANAVTLPAATPPTRVRTSALTATTTGESLDGKWPMAPAIRADAIPPQGVAPAPVPTPVPAPRNPTPATAASTQATPPRAVKPGSQSTNVTMPGIGRSPAIETASAAPGAILSNAGSASADTVASEIETVARDDISRATARADNVQPFQAQRGNVGAVPGAAPPQLPMPAISNTHTSPAPTPSAMPPVPSATGSLPHTPPPPPSQDGGAPAAPAAIVKPQFTADLLMPSAALPIMTQTSPNLQVERARDIRSFSPEPATTLSPAEPDALPRPAAISQPATKISQVKPDAAHRLPPTLRANVNLLPEPTSEPATDVPAAAIGNTRALARPGISPTAAQAPVNTGAPQPTAGPAPAPVAGPIASNTAPTAIPALQSGPAPRASGTDSDPDKALQDGPQAAAPVAAPATGDPAQASPLPASASTAAPTVSLSTPALPTPAAQLAQAVAGVHLAAGAQGQVTIHLQPGDLGAVQVKIERAPDGTATVTVQVEKSDTLQTLQQDISHLHQALDRAGVPAEQRQVTLHLAPAASTADTGASSGNGHGAGQGFGQSPGQGPGAGGSFSRGGQSQPQSRDPQAAQSSPATDDADQPHWQPVGVNITA
jgi:hypothetical protein